MDDLRKPDVATIIISRVDGGVTVMQFVINEYRPTTEQERMAGAGPRIVTRHTEPTLQNIEIEIDRSRPAWLPEWQPVSWRFAKANEVPLDRTFREAWKDEQGIKVHMPKAKEILKEQIRQARQPLLEDLDIAYQRADEEKNDSEKHRIVTEKKRLRDATQDPRIAAASTPDELKTIWPI